MITQVVQTFTTRGKLQPIQWPNIVSQLPMSSFKLLTPGEYISSATLKVSQLEQGGTLCH